MKGHYKNNDLSNIFSEKPIAGFSKEGMLTDNNSISFFGSVVKFIKNNGKWWATL